VYLYNWIRLIVEVLSQAATVIQVTIKILIINLAKFAILDVNHALKIMKIVKYVINLF